MCVDYPQTNPPPLLEIGKSPVVIRILMLNSDIMKYRVDAYRNNTIIKGGKILLDSIDEAIKLAKNVAAHYHCYTRIARVQA